MPVPDTRGLLIAFEGVEGAGKSTQIEAVARVLRSRGYPVRTTFEPGATALGASIRSLVMEPDGAPVSPMAEMLLYLADRAQHIEEVIRPALQRGEVVLCDRFSGSTIAYQGYGRGLDVDLVVQFDAAVRSEIAPALTILLDCPVDEGLRRASGNDRLRRENLGFHQRVRDGFHRLARTQPNWIVVRSAPPVENVTGLVVEAVTAFLERHPKS